MPTYINTYIYIHICACVCVRVCMCVYVSTRVRKYLRTYVCVCMCMCMRTCVYLHIYIYMYTYIHIYVCVCGCSRKRRNQPRLRMFSALERSTTRLCSRLSSDWHSMAWAHQPKASNSLYLDPQNKQKNCPIPLKGALNAAVLHSFVLQRMRKHALKQ